MISMWVSAQPPVLPASSTTTEPSPSAHASDRVPVSTGGTLAIGGYTGQNLTGVPIGCVASHASAEYTPLSFGRRLPTGHPRELALGLGQRRVQFHGVLVRAAGVRVGVADPVSVPLPHERQDLGLPQDVVQVGRDVEQLAPRPGRA